MAEQIKYTFDKITLGKIGRGALIASTGALALYLLEATGKIDIGALTPLIAALIPILVNIVKEWMKGTTPTI